jgi:hypothetical protein
MKSLLILSILLIHCTLLHGQDWSFKKPDYKKIEKSIKKKKSNLYYAKLMDRFQQSDSTLTLKERRYLYYGYTFDSNYSPYSRSKFSDSLRAIFNKEELAEEDLTKIIEFGDAILAENPFDLNAMNYQLYAFDQQKEYKKLNNKIVQLNILLDALFSSGNGKNKKDAFYVINTSHEYNMLDVLGLGFGGSQSLRGHYDYLTVAENDAGIEGLYFDVSPCLNSMAEIFGK